MTEIKRRVHWHYGKENPATHEVLRDGRWYQPCPYCTDGLVTGTNTACMVCNATQGAPNKGLHECVAMSDRPVVEYHRLVVEPERDEVINLDLPYSEVQRLANGEGLSIAGAAQFALLDAIVTRSVR